MDILDPLSLRVLGCLMEKELSTPEYYPLTFNALLAACNQSSNRDPVLRLEEAQVREGIDGLQAAELLFVVSGAGSRVQKYEHRATGHFELSLQEAAILCELILRGPQTPGELRSRSTRLYEFADLAEVEAALEALMDRESPLVLRLPRAPGAREARVAQLLGGLVDGATPTAAVSASPGRFERLEAELQTLRQELSALKAEFEAFKAQF